MDATTRNRGEKATRLIDQNRVVPVNDDRTVYFVRGDSGTYLVAVPTADQITQAVGTGTYTGQSCTCPAQGECSHIVAARMVRDYANDDHADDPFAGI